MVNGYFPLQPGPPRAFRVPQPDELRDELALNWVGRAYGDEDHQRFSGLQFFLQTGNKKIGFSRLSSSLVLKLTLLTLASPWKNPENVIFDPQYSQKWPLKTVKMSIFFIENLHFWGYISTFGAENTTKSRPFKVENNAQTLPKQLQNNFEKVQKTIFSTPKMAKSRMSTWPKVSIFGSIFGLRALFLAYWYWKKN